MGLETANTGKMIIVSRGSKGMGGGLVKLLLSGTYSCSVSALYFTRLILLAGDVYVEDPGQLKPW